MNASQRVRSKRKDHETPISRLLPLITTLQADKEGKSDGQIVFWRQKKQQVDGLLASSKSEDPLEVLNAFSGQTPLEQVRLGVSGVMGEQATHECSRYALQVATFALKSYECSRDSPHALELLENASLYADMGLKASEKISNPNLKIPLLRDSLNLLGISTLRIGQAISNSETPKAVAEAERLILKAVKYDSTKASEINLALVYAARGQDMRSAEILSRLGKDHPNRAVRELARKNLALLRSGGGKK